MNHQRLALFAFLLILIGSLADQSPSMASDKAARIPNDSGLSKRQILQMGLLPFLEAYQNERHYSWQVRENAYLLYAHYKDQDNQYRLAHLPRRYRSQVKHLYTILGKWEDDAFTLRYAEMSDGTAVRDIAFRRPAEFEEYIGRMISFSTSSSQINGVSQIEQQQASNVIAHLLRHFVEIQMEDNVQHRSEFRQSLKAFRADTMALLSLLPLVPQQGRETFIKHLHHFAEDVG